MKDSNALKITSIITLYIIYLLDIASIVIVLILFSDLLLDRTSTLVPLATTLEKRNLILGFLFAAYPATQFLGAPILGELSDRFGRKLLLNISILGTAFAYFLCAISILESQLHLLFLGRLIGGFFAGNASLAQATVSNIVAKKNLSRAMALFSAVGGISWIIGPFLGSFFSNPKVVPWFSIDTPFWIMGISLLVCWGLFMLSYTCMHIKKDKEKLSIKTIYLNLWSIFEHKIIIVPLAVTLIADLGWMMIQNFFSPFLMEKFSFNKDQTSYVFAYMSIWWLLGALLATYIFKSFRPSRFLVFTQFIAALMVYFYVTDKTFNFIYWAVAISNFSFAIGFSAYNALFAHLIPAKQLGKLFGTWTGGFALINCIAPAFGGWASSFGLNVPFQVGAAIMLLTIAVMQVWLVRNRARLVAKKV